MTIPLYLRKNIEVDISKSGLNNEFTPEVAFIVTWRNTFNIPGTSKVNC
jgi:hypothetical protein